MSNDPGAADHGKKSWYWFESECMKATHPDIDSVQLDRYLHRRWNQLPGDYKESLLPALIRVYGAFERKLEAQAAHNTTDCMNLQAWHEATFKQLNLYADQFATADERMATLKKLLAAEMECYAALQDLISARDHYAKQELLSPEGSRALERLPTQADNQAADIEKQITDLEVLLPQFRAAEQAWRKQKLDMGIPVGVGWVGSWYLGGGAFGQAFLWVRQDSDGCIVDRIVTKDATIDQTMETEENAWKLHEGVYVPAEVRAPQLLSGKLGSETILQVRGWRKYPGADFFRVLMEFCPHGDLYDVRCEGPYTKNPSIGKYQPQLPEPFLWYVFECLATAGVLMGRGALQREALEGWEQIYHSDIKLCNVMLRPPNPKKYCHYPSPVLADFGFAQFCPAGEKRRGRGGTPTCESPENGAPYYLKNGQYVFPKGYLNSRSDVWSVGNVIWSLMLIREGDNSMDFRRNPRPREPPVGNMRGLYGQALVDLVLACMKYHAEDRIGFEELLRRIRLHTGLHKDPRYDHVQGLRTAAANDPAWQQPGVKLLTPVDKFPLYSRLARLPDEKDELAIPPHKTRKLSEEMEFKGLISADTKSLRRAGSVRKHAATHTWLEHQRWLQKRRKLEDFKARGGFYVPDSDEDGDEEDIQGIRDDDVTFEPARGPESLGANAVSATDFAAGNQQKDTHQDMEFDDYVPPPTRAQARKSLSAATGAKISHQHQQVDEEMKIKTSITPTNRQSRSAARKPRSGGRAQQQVAAVRRPPVLPPVHPVQSGRTAIRQSRSANAGARSPVKPSPWQRKEGGSRSASRERKSP